MQKQITHLNFAKGFRGGERQTQLLIEQLSSFGYMQKLIVRKDSELILRCENINNLEIVEINKPYIFHLKHIGESSILHAHETKALQFAYLANLFTKVPYIVTRRVDNPIKNNFFNTKLYTNANYSVALSNAIKNGILLVSPKANTRIIPSAFSPSLVDEIKSKKIKARFKDKFLIGHIGALVDIHKGQKVILSLAKIVEKSHPQIHFLLVGGGSDEAMLRDMAKDLSNVTFEGFVNNVNDYIASFDMFLFPSRNEGLGSTLLDVMNIGVPIVASEVGGIVDIIKHNQNGILFDIADIKTLENIVIDLYNDKYKREKFVINAKQDIQNYSVESMAKSYIELYKSVI